MLFVYKIYFMQGLIFTYFIWILFLLHKCKIHAFTFPQVDPPPILCCVVLFFSPTWIALAYNSPASLHIKSSHGVFFFCFFFLKYITSINYHKRHDSKCETLLVQNWKQNLDELLYLYLLLIGQHKNLLKCPEELCIIIGTGSIHVTVTVLIF